MLAAVRIRGTVKVREDVSNTLTQLQLPQRHAAMLYPDTDSIQGMLEKADGYITYGPVNQDTVTHLLEKRGKVNGQPLPDAVNALGFDTVNDLAEALINEEVTIQQLRDQGLNTPFTLSPPSNGFNATKKHVNQGGSLGKRDNLDNLITDMA